MNAQFLKISRRTEVVRGNYPVDRRITPLGDKEMRMRYIVFCLMVMVAGFVTALPANAEEVLTWDECVKQAAGNNPDLISAEAVVKGSKASKDITASGLYPQIQSSVSGSTAKTGSKTTADTYSYGVSGSQLLFDGFKTVNNVKAGTENVKASQQRYRFTSVEVRLRLRTAFINLLKAQESLGVTKDIVQIRKNIVGLIMLRYTSGLEHKGALLTAEADFARAEFETAQVQRSLEVFQRQLTKEMGRTIFTPLRVTGDFTVVDVAKERPDFEALADKNPTFQQFVAQKNAAAYGVKSAYGNFFPQLSGQADAGKTGGHWPPQSEQWGLGVSMSVPLFEGGLKTAQLAQAKAQLTQADADLRSTRDGLVSALEQRWAALQDAIALVGVQQKALDAAQERAKIAEAQYSTGFITYDNWAIIEDNYVNAKKTYLDAQANILIAETNWIEAKGETLEYAQ